MHQQHPGEKNLNTYRILFLIKGILDLCIAFIGFIYIGIGSMAGRFFDRLSYETGEDIPVNPGIFFVIVGVILILLALFTGIPALIASKRFSQKRGRTFIIIAAAINCLTGLLGILLCIFTVLELQKPAVKEIFAQNDGAS
ncbi:MAG: hypothetical protein ACFHU9_03085 [Fluviicola sp.]